MTDDTNEVDDDFDVFDDSIDLDADDTEHKTVTVEEEDEEELQGETESDEAEEAEEEEEPEPPSGEDEKTSGQLAALKAERLARQKYQEEYQKLKNKYEPEIDPNEPDPVEDPEGWKSWARETAKKEELAERINASRTEMLKVDDYEDKEMLFTVLARKNPELIEKMNKHPEPAKFAYETAAKYEQEKEAKIRQKIMAELGTQDVSKSKKRKVPDLTGTTAIGSNKTKVETISDDDDLFEDSPFRIGVKR